MTKPTTRFKTVQRCLWALALSLAASCSPPHYMYAPSAAHVSGFTQKNESALDAAFSAHGVDLMGGYAISDRWAILGSWYFRHETQYRDSTRSITNSRHAQADSLRYLRILPSIGLSYSLPLSDQQHYFLVTSLGYGKGRFRMAERNMKVSDPNTLPPAHFTRYYTSLQRIYLQPAFLIKYSAFQVITSLRWSGIQYGFRHDTHLEQFDIADRTLYSFLEGALTLRVTPPRAKGLRFQLQCGAALPGTNVRFDYHGIIGNIGVGIDPVKLFSGDPAKKLPPGD